MQQPTKSAILYGGKVKIDFFEGRHSYVLNGKPLISVTACTGIIDKSRPLLIWAERLAANDLLEKLKAGRKLTEEDVLTATGLHRVYKKEAADTGTLIHNFAEAWVKHKLKIIKDGPEMPSDEKVLNGAMAFLKWVDEHKVKFIAAEKLVYSKKHNYVGLCDTIFTMGSEKHKILHVGDYKSSKAIYNEYRYQVAAYQEADAEESGAIYGTKWLMRFDKETGEFEAHEYAEHQQDFKVFLACLTIKKREKELSKW
jgi:hypothetical protein